jgi:LuxR family transcriptional regulator, positive regulator of biofilm formation
MNDFLANSNVNNPEAALVRRLGARPSEARVGLLLMQGFGNKEIARKLNITESTVKAHVSSLLRLSNVHNRVQLTNLLFSVSPGINRSMQYESSPSQR